MKNKFAFLGVFLLVSTMMLGSLPNDAEARTEYDTILRIATQAHNEIKIQLDRTDRISDEVKLLFKEGSQELDALKQAIRAEKPEAAKRHFLTAMDIFKKISYMISDRPTAESANVDRVADRPDLKSALERTEKYFINLKNIARTHGADVDFSQLHDLFSLAKQQIREGSYDDAQKSINQIHRLIVDINSKLREAAQQKSTDRAKAFAQKYLDRLDSIIAEAEELGYPSDIIDKLKDAKTRLSESSDPRQIISEIKSILSIKQQFDLSKFERIISRADQIEEKIDELSSKDGVNLDDVDNARELIVELRSKIDNRNYDEAHSLLRTLMDALKSLENSIG
ncbi:MAG: hypothetical protein R3230_02610 [Nitrosopumilaceae archaeon]|nr:hypothetical protein [Nitrosopumilaceae archaeon]